MKTTAGTSKNTGSKAESPNNELSPAEQAYRNKIIPYLLTRAYHLPGNSWLQDWYSYMTNNHPLFGICFHHKYHPIKPCVRIVSLIGSILFGLAVTNIIYLAFVFTDREYEHTYIDIKTNATQGFHSGSAYVDQNVQPALTVTNGNIALWTVGAALHALYDNTVWSLAACTCCMNNNGITEERLARFRSRGVLLVMLLVIVITAVATFAVAIRSAVNEMEKESDTADKIGLTDEQVKIWQDRDANEFEFLIAYFVELVLNFLVYYPVIGSILFSGCLTCGRFPVIGGRPYEMKHDVEQPEQGRHSTTASSQSKPPSPPRGQEGARSSSPRQQISNQQTSQRPPMTQQPIARSSSPKRQPSNRQPVLRTEKKTSGR